MELITNKIETEGLKLFGTSRAIVKLEKELKLSFIADTHMVLPDTGLTFEESKLKYNININFKPIMQPNEDNVKIEYKIKDDTTLEIKYINPSAVYAISKPIPIINDKENDVIIYLQTYVNAIMTRTIGTCFEVQFYFYER